MRAACLTRLKPSFVFFSDLLEQVPARAIRWNYRRDTRLEDTRQQALTR